MIITVFRIFAYNNVLNNIIFHPLNTSYIYVTLYNKKMKKVKGRLAPHDLCEGYKDHRKYCKKEKLRL